MYVTSSPCLRAHRALIYSLDMRYVSAIHYYYIIYLLGNSLDEQVP